MNEIIKDNNSKSDTASPPFG